MSESIENKGEGCGASCSCGAESSGLAFSPMDRRKFISLGALAAATVALAACAGAVDSVTSPGSVSAMVKISDYSALATVGGVAVTSLNGTPIAIVRTGAATFMTLSRVCPHQGSTIGQISGGFRCPNHGATFNTTGTWTGGQRTSNMRSYTTSYDATAGTLTIG